MTSPDALTSFVKEAFTIADRRILLILGQVDNAPLILQKTGLDVIVYVKVIDGVGYRHVEEVRGKRRLVATDSLRKKKGAWSA